MPSRHEYEIEPPDTRRRVLHLDLDAFYVSVERALNPRLRGRPVVVGGRADARGVVSGASTEARTAGIYPALPIVKARKLCPDLVVVPGDFELYESTARTLLDFLRRFSPLRERAAVDRIYLDLSGTQPLWGGALDVGARLRHDLKERFSLLPTIGVAVNKLVAKVASDSVRSGGLCDVTPGSEADFLAPLPVGRLPGVGSQTQKRLEDFNITAIHDLAAAGSPFLERALGRHGRVLYAHALGIDHSPVGNKTKLQAITSETTLRHETNDLYVLKDTLRERVEESGYNLRRENAWAQRVRVAVGFVDSVHQYQIARLPQPTDLDDEILAVADTMLERLLERRITVRHLALRLSGLSWCTGQMTLMDDDRNYDKRRSLMRAIDKIRTVHGAGALVSASTLPNTLTPEWDTKADISTGKWPA